MVPPDFIAELKYKSVEEGGRKTKASSGYRPVLKFPFTEMMASGQQVFVGQTSVKPGETVVAEITMIYYDEFVNRLYEGLEFDFREGNKVIGTGKIIEILNSILRKP